MQKITYFTTQPSEICISFLISFNRQIYQYIYVYKKKQIDNIETTITES